MGGVWEDLWGTYAGDWSPLLGKEDNGKRWGRGYFECHGVVSRRATIMIENFMIFWISAMIRYSFLRQIS